MAHDFLHHHGRAKSPSRSTGTQVPAQLDTGAFAATTVTSAKMSKGVTDGTWEHFPIRFRVNRGLFERIAEFQRPSDQSEEGSPSYRPKALLRSAAQQDFALGPTDQNATARLVGFSFGQFGRQGFSNPSDPADSIARDMSGISVSEACTVAPRSISVSESPASYHRRTDLLL